MDTYSYEKIVPFIGTGTSYPLGILDWPQLLNNLINECDKKFQIICSKKLNESDKWPELAEDIYSHLGHDRYQGIVQKGITPRVNSSTLSLLKIVLASRIQLTTNFDLSIEEAYKFFNFMSSKQIVDKTITLEKKYLPDLEEYPDDKTKNYLYYLHGNKDKKYFILKKSDYEMFYPSVSTGNPLVKRVQSLEILLRTVYINYNIVFIGFSFADKYLRDYFFKLSNTLRMEEQNNHKSLYNPSNIKVDTKKYIHFLLIDADNLLYKADKAKFFHEYENNNIYPIVYKSGHHLFIEELFGELLSKVKI